METLRAERNKLGKDDIAKGKKLKLELKGQEGKLKQVESEFAALQLLVPNPAAEDVKVGTAENNEVTKLWVNNQNLILKLEIMWK